MLTPFHTLDVFTDRAFAGNPLAVVTDGSAVPEERLLAIAREFNLSETVFVYPPEDPAHTARVRIFTPARELPFAGHPTVGCAILLAKLRGLAERVTVTLEEAIGVVPVKVVQGDGAAFGQLSAAKLPERIVSRASRATIARAIGLAASDVLQRGGDALVYSAGVPFLFVEVGDRATLARCRPDSAAWDAANGELEGIFVFTRDAEGEGSAFRARMFAPGLSVPEDPATGSAVAALAGYICEVDRLRDGAHHWRVEQGFEMGRPSILELECDVSGGSLRAVRVGGSAVIVSRGELLV